MFVAQSGLVLICLVARQMGAPCGLITSGAESGGAPFLLHNHVKPRPLEGDKGVAKIKMHPPPFLLCPSVPSLLFLLTTIAPPQGSSDQGLIRIVENFRAEGAKFF